MMSVLYDSSSYVVLEYSGRDGIELVDKASGRGAFLQGLLARRCRSGIRSAIEANPTAEAVDEFLGHYDALLTTPATYH